MHPTDDASSYRPRDRPLPSMAITRRGRRPAAASSGSGSGGSEDDSDYVPDEVEEEEAYDDDAIEDAEEADEGGRRVDTRCVSHWVPGIGEGLARMDDCLKRRAEDEGSAMAFVLRTNERLSRESVRSRKLLVERAADVAALEKEVVALERSRQCCAALLRNESERGHLLHEVLRDRDAAGSRASAAMRLFQAALACAMVSTWMGLTVAVAAVVHRDGATDGDGLPDAVPCFALNSAAVLLAAWMMCAAAARGTVARLVAHSDRGLALRVRLRAVEEDDRNVGAVLELATGFRSRR